MVSTGQFFTKSFSILPIIEAFMKLLLRYAKVKIEVESQSSVKFAKLLSLYLSFSEGFIKLH